MAFDTSPFTSAGNRVTRSVTAASLRATGKKPPKKKAPPKYAPNDAFPASLLVPTLSDAQLQGQAHAAAGADVAAHLAAIPTDASVQGQYGQLGSNIAGINQALVDALGGTQRFQIGTANGIAQGYTAAAGADQSAAQQAAAALGGSAGQLSGTGGQAAAALSAPGVSAANATGGLIDAAKIRGANQQITNQQELATALAALGASRTAEQAKEGSYYQGYLSDAQKANQSALQANQDAAFKYANLGIAQQNANSRAAYDSALAALSGQRVGLQATGLADTSSYRAGMLAQGADRTAIARENAATSRYRAQHPAAGTQRDPATGLTAAQRSTHLGSTLDQARQIAQQGFTKGSGTKDVTTGKVKFSFTPPKAMLGTTGQPDPLAPTPHPIQKEVSLAAWRAYQRTGDVRALGGIVQPGSSIDRNQKVYTTSKTSSQPAHSYYDTLRAVKAALGQDNEVYGYGLSDADLTRRAQQITNPIFHGMYGMPTGPGGKKPAPKPSAPPVDSYGSGRKTRG